MNQENISIISGNKELDINKNLYYQILDFCIEQLKNDLAPYKIDAILSKYFTNMGDRFSIIYSEKNKILALLFAEYKDDLFLQDELVFIRSFVIDKSIRKSEQNRIYKEIINNIEKENEVGSYLYDIKKKVFKLY